MYSIDEILNDEIDDNHENNDLSGDENQENDLENVQEDGNPQDDEAEEVKKDVKDDDDDDKKKKPKRKINRVNLNAERLKGPRGLICMENTFSKLKFRGKGYEQQDLDTVMSSLQHWCHRLYPKFTFDDTLDQIEKLGTKKTVMVLRKKIIMNMLDDEPVQNQDDENDDEPIMQQESPPPPPVDKFDSLFDNRPPLRQREPSPEITEEQLAIIERNRMLAAERRRVKMAQENKEKEHLENTNDNEVIEQSNNETTINKSIVSTVEPMEAE